MKVQKVLTPGVQFLDLPIQGITGFQALGCKWNQVELNLFCLKDESIHLR